MSEGKQLSPRQRRFVEEYLVDMNGAKAAMRAGYAEKSARIRACTILKEPEVAEAVRAAMAARTERTRVNADRVIRELERIAFADIRKYAVADEEEGIRLKTLDQLTDDEAAAVVEISSGVKGGGFRLKLHDKKKALDALARHTGVFAARRTEPKNPHAEAERIRALILGRLARLSQPDEAG